MLVDGAIVHKSNGDWTAGDGSRHARAEMQWDATFQRRINRVAVNITGSIRDIMA